MMANSDDWEKASLEQFFNTLIDCATWWLIVMIVRRLVWNSSSIH